MKVRSGTEMHTFYTCVIIADDRVWYDAVYE